MPDLIKNPNATRASTNTTKKKKKDEVEQRLSAGTASGTKSTTTPLTSTGQKKKDTVAKNLSSTDKRTGSSTYAQQERKNEETRKSSQEAKTKLSQYGLGSDTAAEIREQAETAKKRANDASRKGHRSAYKDYVVGEKEYQTSLAETRSLQQANQKELIEQEQRKDRLRTWDLESAKKDLAEKKVNAENAQRGIQELTRQMNAAADKGDQAAVLRLNGQLQILKEQVEDYKQFNSDYVYAESLQYLEKGRSFLEDMQKNDSATFGLVDTIARSKVFGLENASGNAAALMVGQKTPEDVAKETIDDKTIDEAYQKLRAAGYQPKDIEQWIDWQVRILNEEQARDVIARGQQFAHENALEATLGGRILNPLAGAGVLEATADVLTGTPIDFNSSAMMPGMLNQAMTEQVSQDIMEKHPGAGGQVLNFLYQSGVSMADSTVNAALAGVGIPEQVGLVLMAGSAAVPALKEAHDRGLTDAQALTVGLIAGGAEYVTERIELKSLMDILKDTGDPLTLGQRAKKILMNRLKQAHEEGREEVMSDIINFVADVAVFDGNQINAKIKQYENMGYSNYDAIQKALVDQVKDTALSYAGGFLSGWVMGGAAGYINTASNAKVTTDYYTGMAAGKGTAAYDAAENLRRVIDEIDTKTEDEITFDDHAAYQQAVNELTEALNALPDSSLKEARKEGRELKKIDKERAKTNIGELLGIREALEQFRRNPEQVELDNTVYSQHGIVQQAAGLVATGKQKNISTAVSNIMKSPDAVEALGLSFDKKTSNTQKRTQILTALKEVVAKAQEAQATPQAETPVEVNNSTEETPVTTEATAVSPEDVTEETPVDETTPPETLISYEEYDRGVREKNPEMTQEETRQAYDELAKAYEEDQQAKAALQEAAAQAEQVKQDIKDREGKRVYIKEAKRAVDYDTFRRWALTNVKSDGNAYTEEEVRSAFDAGVVATQAETAKYELKRRKGVTDAGERIQKAFKKNQLSIGARVSFDGKDFGGTSATEHAFYDPETNSVVFNGDILDTEAAMVYYLGHEVVHNAKYGDTGLVDEIITTFQALSEAGKLRGELADMMENMDGEINYLQTAYQEHENELAKKEERDARTIDKDYAREEFAANLMRYAFGHTKLFKDIAGRRPGLVVRMKQAVSSVMSAVSGDPEIEAAMQKLGTRLDEALAKAAENVTKDTDEQPGLRLSIASGCRAAGIEAVRDQDTGRIIFLLNGQPVTEITANHIKHNSAFGAFITMANKGVRDPKTGKLMEGVLQPKTFITDEQAKEQYKAVADLFNLIMRTQNPDMVWAFAGSQLFAAVKSNSDGQYSTTVDFTTVCRKTADMIQAMSTAMMERGRGLTKAEVTQLQHDMIKAGLQVPCPVCYVFSRWAGIGSILDKMRQFQEKYPLGTDPAVIQARIAELESMGKKEMTIKLREELSQFDEEYISLTAELESVQDERKTLQAALRAAKKAAKKTKDTTEVERLESQLKVNDFRKKGLQKQIEDKVKQEDKYAQELSWLKKVRTKKGYEPVRNDILFNMADANAIETFMNKYPASWSYRTGRGPSAGKAILPYSDMRVGDFVLPLGSKSSDGNKTFADPLSIHGSFNADQTEAIIGAIARVRAQNLIGGQRFQSTSDFRYDYALDYIQTFFEAQALGSCMQTYTKIIEFAELVARIGGDVNMSAMPKDKGYAVVDGKPHHLIYSYVTGINMDAAKKLAAEFDSAQVILVGINDEHIKLALNDSEETGGIYVGFVIPYHTSGASIEEFIRVLVSNLNEEFVRSNYQDYSDVQTDHAKADATEDQLRRRELRKQILTGKVTQIGDNGKKKSVPWTPSSEELAFLQADADKQTDIRGRSFEDLLAVETAAMNGDAAAIQEYESWSSGLLWGLYEKMWTKDGSENGVRLTAKQAEAIMPHEYWDKTSTRDTAYISGFIFRSLCYNLGLSPRFTGINPKGKVVDHGDFRSERGYWKTLIDRAMYKNDGTYRDQQQINLSEMPVEAITPEYGEEHWAGYKVAEPQPEVAKQVGKDFAQRSFSIAYDGTASDSARKSLEQARDMLHEYTMHNSTWPVPADVMLNIREKTGWWMSSFDHHWRYWIPDAEARWNEYNDNLSSKDPDTVFDLYDVIHHPRLFNHYPQLDYTRVVFDLDPGGDTQGSFDADQGLIHLKTGASISNLSTEGKITLSTLLHEIQHAIQQFEVDRWNSIQNGSNTNAGYKQAFVFAFDDITDGGRDLSMFEGLSYKQAVRKVEQRIAKLFRNTSGMTEAERQGTVDDIFTADDVGELEKAELARRKGLSVKAAVQEAAYEYYYQALGEIDARTTGDTYLSTSIIDRDGAIDPERLALRNTVDKRIQYGEESVRGDFSSIREDIARFDQISEELGWDGTRAGRYSANYPLSEERRFSIAKAPGEDTTLHIPDGMANGQVISFTDLILDGKKLGETRGLNVHLPVGRWIGIDKNGQVVGRVILGEPKRITNQSPEYKDSYIKGTKYDLADGEEKLYYPIVDVVDMRDGPKPVLRSSAQYGVYQTGDTNTGGRQFSIDLGYHAGDLGKSRADGYWGMGGRSTGHFGTGTYFVGDKASLVNTGYDRRPLETADFSQYNLFRPRSTQQGYDLHDALKGINNYIEGLPVAKMDFDAYYDLTHGVKDAMLDAIFEDDVSKREQVLDFIRQYLGDYSVKKLYEKAQQRYDEIHFEDTQEARDEYRADMERYRESVLKQYDGKVRFEATVDEEVENWAKRHREAAAQYDEDARKMSVEDIIFAYDDGLQNAVDNAIANIDNLRRWYRMAAFDLRMALGLSLFTEAEIQDALQKTYDTVQTYTDRNAFYDSASTVFMKALGYDGIDVRGIKGLDNTSYGSVIYDLVGDDLARKQEIGTARYSLQQDDELLQAFIDAYENKQGDGQLKKDFPTIEQQLREARRELARAEKKAESEHAKRLVAEKVTKKTREAWQLYAKKTVQQKSEKFKAKLAEEREAKVKAVREAVQKTRADERKKAEEKTRKAVAKAQEKAKNKEILARNAALSTLRNKEMADRRRTIIETQQGPIDTMRKSPQERTFREKVADAAEKLRVTGRDLYAKFVSQSAEIERVTRRQRGPMGASTLATIVGGVGSTVNYVFTKNLVDRAGDTIGGSFTDTFICTENNAGKVIDEPMQALLQDYLLHRHNIDRMSFVTRSQERLEEFEQQHADIAKLDSKQLAKLAALTEAEAKNEGKTEQSKLALEYSRLLQDYLEAQNKPVFADLEGNPIAAETSRERVAQLEREAPWLIEKAAGIDEWWDKFMRAWVVGDSITEEQYDHMREIYPHYVPTYRKDKGGFGFSFSSSNGATPGKFTKRAIGSTKEVVNVEDSFANLVQKAIKQARINELYKNLVDTAMRDTDGTFADMMFFDWFQYGRDIQEAARIDIGDHIEERDTAGLSKDGDGYRVSAWYAGELIHTYVSEALFKSLSLTVGHASDRLDKLARLGSALTSPMKTAITGINPNFALRNVMRDFPTAVINSVSGLAFPKYWLQAVGEIHRNSEHWQRYQALGGGDALYYNNEGGYGKATNMTKGTKGSVQRGWNTVKGKVGWFNEITESVTRFAEYLATIEKLGDTYEGRLQARKNAAEVTVDFSRHGEYGKAINAWIPYWNPAVQGIDKVFRSVFSTQEGQSRLKHALSTLGRAGVTTALLEAVLYLLLKRTGKDKDWEKLNDRTKDTYYCLPATWLGPAAKALGLDEHDFIKIPKNREWGAVLGTPLMRLLEWGFNGRSDPFENYIETSIVPNFLPGMPTDMIGFSQYIDLATNKDFAGRAIIPYAYQQGSKAGQYDSDTSVFSKWISDQIGNVISPMQIDYIVRDYFGDFGKMWQMMTSRAFLSGDKSPKEVGQYMEEVVLSPWNADNRFSNQYMSKYYEIRDELEDKVNDLKNHTDGDSYKESIEYKTYQALTKGLGKDISDLNKSIRNETDEDKKAQVKGEMTELAQQAIQFYEDSMAGKIDDPELVVAYRDLPQSVSDALIKLDDLTKDYAIKPSEVNTDTMAAEGTLKIGNTTVYQYKLDDEAKQKRTDLREQYYAEYMQKTVDSSTFKTANEKKQAEMLEDARSDAYDAAADDFNDWLKKNRKPELKEDKHLPDAYKALSSATKTELTNLYGQSGTEKYTFTPSDSTTKSYTDPNSKVGNKATREYKLDDEAIAYHNKLRQQYYESYVAKVMKSAAYKNASPARKAELLAEARTKAYDQAKDDFMKWLKKNRKSTPRE